MQLTSVYVKNFGSYEELHFRFQNRGLTLIQGPTGSGKSTLMDIVPWILFGRTAKDGAADEVLNWTADGQTYGSLTLSLNGRDVNICRARRPNDLYYTTSDGVSPIRGKDLNDTQKLINNLLGMDVNTYLAGAYYHEFSQTAQFFTATAKTRRSICEQLVDLSFFKNLQEKLSASKKQVNNNVDDFEASIDNLESKIEIYKENHNKYSKSHENFDFQKGFKLGALDYDIKALLATVKPVEYYDSLYKEINEEAHKVDNKGVCSECGGPKNRKGHEAIAAKMRSLESQKYKNQLDFNKLMSLVAEHDKLEASVNNFQELLDNNQVELKKAEDKLRQYKNTHFEHITKLADLELLEETASNGRASTIKNTIKALEASTNLMLSNYFDAEIKVIFEVESADKLDVTILKDGNNCSYTQLSKGQRGLLKLCFGLSVMSVVAKHSGVKFNCIMLDEALDGLSDELKVKSYNLLKTLELEYSSIFVVEHSMELKALFEKQISVKLVNGNSQIEET